MTQRKLLLASLAAAIIGGASLPSLARTNVDFYVNVAPPALPYEAVPAPRVGFVWVPGRYTRPRPGYLYAPARWVARDGR